MRRLLIPMAAALLALPILHAGALPADDAVIKGAAYIKTTQGADGGYAAFFGQSMDAIFAVRAAGYDPAKDIQGGKSPVDYLAANAPTLESPAAAAKGALAAKAMGLDPASVAGTDLVALIEGAYDAATGAYAGGDTFTQAISMLGLACTGNTVGAKAVEALRLNQVEDSGGWTWAADAGPADVDSTAIAIQALLAAGVPKTDLAIADGLEFLKTTQLEDGGWGFDMTASNTSSTAYAVQALLALGEDPESVAWTKGGGATPITYLVGQQSADGSFPGFDPGFATNQVVPALAGRTFCNAAETPITGTRPVATPTPATPEATATPAPRPPSTGNTPASSGTESGPALAIVALALLASGAIVAARGRR